MVCSALKGLGSQTLPSCLPYRTASCRTGADARAHAERGVPGTRSCGLLARCASGYDGDLYQALPFVGHWCPDFAPPYACLRDAGPVAPVGRPLLRPPIVASLGSLSCMVCSARALRVCYALCRDALVHPLLVFRTVAWDHCGWPEAPSLYGTLALRDVRQPVRGSHSALSLPPHLQRSYTRGVIPPSPAIHTLGENLSPGLDNSTGNSTVTRQLLDSYLTG